MSSPKPSDPCPCGSGKKYKKCCLGKTATTLAISDQAAKSQSPGFNATNVLPLSGPLLKAVALHQAGQLEEAEAAYQALLRDNPNDSDALHYLGLIAFQKGDYPDAAHLIEQAIKFNGSVPAFHFNLGNAYKQIKQFDSAIGAYLEAIRLDPSFLKVYLNLGNTLRDQGKFDAAVESYYKALALKPDYAEAHNNLGFALQVQGRLDAAVESYHHALSLKPGYAEAHNNLGAALQTQGRLDAAVESYQKALSIRPDYAEAHSNLGLALQAQGRLDAAVESYQKALSIRPDYAEAHFNLGNALRAQCHLDAAIGSYQKALSIRPDYVEAHNNLGNALNELGEFGAAADSFINALKLAETPEIKDGFACCLEYVYFTRYDADTRHFVMRAMSETWGHPSFFVAASISLINLNRSIKACIERATKAWPTRLPERKLFGPSGLAAVADDQLLKCLLENAPVCDIKLEQFLTMARLAMLHAVTGDVIPGASEEKVLAFYCALARQCFINEYVFGYTDEEIEQARLLRERLVAALASGLPVPVLWLAGVAAYFPLFSLPSTEALLDQPWPEPIAALLVQQVREPLEERQLRAGIPSLTPVEDDVSRLVQQQYEENPYPRWVKSPLGGKAETVDDFLRRQFPLMPFRPLGKSDEVDILIAGCGTGRHPIQTAQQFCGASVLAVDLSLTSLSYAKRKTQELGLNNIEYAQADIMKLGSIGRTFDIIESVGVLHHLADPMAGWRELLSLLRPGGFMRLGLYSELGRQHIVAARNFIARHGYVASAVDIRQFRQDIMSMNTGMEAEIIKVMSGPDFFTASACRDLLFHVQEHRFTLPQIKECLRELGLDFIGLFVLGPYTRKQYVERFPDDKAMSDIDSWSIFETENPSTFAGMYQFCVQKRGKRIDNMPMNDFQ